MESVSSRDTLSKNSIFFNVYDKKICGNVSFEIPNNQIIRSQPTILYVVNEM